jgi:YceI-like domain
MHSYRTRLDGLLGLFLILGPAGCSGGSNGGTSTGSKAKASGGAGSSGHGASSGSSGSGGNGSTSTGTGKNGGSAGAGSGGSSGSATACDTSGFVADCMQGGAQWGTEQQSGPCSSGITTYGVHTQYGPYGVRSDYNVGQGFENSGTDDSAFCNGVFIPSFGADPTIRDVTREVSLDVEYGGRAKDPWGNERIGFLAKAALDRKDFGLGWNQVLEAGGVLVGDRVDVELEVQAVKAAAAQAA